MTNPNGPQAPTITDPSLFAVDQPSQDDVFALNQDPDSLFVSINPLTPPEQQTLVYAPEVEIFIARDNKQFDVSRDIVSVAVQRNENAISTLVFRLANKVDPMTNKPRYNQKFERMDRVICRMKRTRWVLVFSGYLDSVPHIQLYPGTVNFRASCTLKRLLHTYWDPGLPASTHVMDQAGMVSAQERAGDYSTDTGLGSMLRRFLVEVGGWHPSNILIQRFPPTYYNFMKRELKKTSSVGEENVKTFESYLLGDDLTLGTWKAASTQPGVNEGPFTTGVLTAPERKMEVLRVVDGKGMGPDNTNINLGQGVAGAAARSQDNKDQPAWAGNTQVGQSLEEAGKVSDAAIHCFMCIAVEAPGWLMYANNAVPESLQLPHDAVGSDGTSVGLYQQTEGNGWGSVRQRMNVRESTEMFLDRLNNLNWRNMDRGTAVQAVQRSGFGGRYAEHEQEAIAEVRQLRQNQTPGSGASSTTGNTGTNIPGVGQAPIPPGQVQKAANQVTATATSDSPQAAASVGGNRPRFDTQGAILYARSKIGCPYGWGDTGPSSFDCSGLTMMAYRSIHLEIGRDTHAQYANGQKIPASQAKPGDLIFPSSVEHVVMVTAPGMVIHSPTTGQTVKEVTMAQAGVTPDMPAVHIQGAEWGGPGAAAFEAFPAGAGYTAGTVANGVDGSVGQTQASEPIARNLFTYMFVTQPPNVVSLLLGSGAEKEKAFMNDQSMLHTVISLCTARLCKFSSAPNGDFQAYYPDYFGLDGKRAILKLEEIEMKNVQIDLNDDMLCTHAYVAGSQSPNISQFGILGWILSKGYATVENKWLFSKMQMAAPIIPGQKMVDGKAIMRHFGARPLVKDMPMVQYGPMEFLCAVQMFMECWAEQYATVIELTFMPDLYTGNRIEVANTGLRVYVSQVTHSCDWEAGFSTTATILAPARSTLERMLTTITDPKSTEDTNNSDLASKAAEWLY